MSDLAAVLDSVAKSAAEVAKYCPPPVNVVAGIIAAALKAGAAIAYSGKDPVAEITRILDQIPEVAKVRSEWENYIKANWPAKSASPPPVGRRKTDPPPPDDTLPGAAVSSGGEDPYEE